MKRNPIISLFVALCLIVSFTGQAAASFRMACEGTASCCCMNEVPVPAMPTDMVPMGLPPMDMDEGCCDTVPIQPCDLAGPVTNPAAPFLPVEINSLQESSLVMAIQAPVTIDRHRYGMPDRIPIGPPALAGPPIYVLIQSFLC